MRDERIGDWCQYTPVLQGATDNPTATYSVQVGRYIIIGKIGIAKFRITTTTMTKTTTSDVVRVSLPFTSANNTNDRTVFTARVENGTAVHNGIQGRVDANTAYATFMYIPSAASSENLTYASGSLGTLTNTINIEGMVIVEIA